MATKDTFRLFLKQWMTANWKGNQTAFANYLGLTRTNLSNILNGYTGTSEESRIKICQKIGIDYRSLIQADIPREEKPHPPPEDTKPSNVLQFNNAETIENAETADQLEKCIEYLHEIFMSGNKDVISITKDYLASAAANRSKSERDKWSEEYRRKIRKRMANH